METWDLRVDPEQTKLIPLKGSISLDLAFHIISNFWRYLFSKNSIFLCYYNIFGPIWGISASIANIDLVFNFCAEFCWNPCPKLSRKFVEFAAGLPVKFYLCKNWSLQWIRKKDWGKRAKVEITFNTRKNTKSLLNHF